MLRLAGGPFRAASNEATVPVCGIGAKSPRAVGQVACHPKAPTAAPTDTAKYARDYG